MIRIAQYLVLHPSGVFHFRQRVPADIQPHLGRKIIKISLKTKCSREALGRAYVLADRYYSFFQSLRTKSMNKPKSVEEILRDVENFQRYEVELPNGTKIKTDGSEVEHQQVLQVLEKLNNNPERNALMQAAYNAAPHLQPPPVAANIEKIKLRDVGQSFDLWLEANTSVRKTLITKKAVAKAFLQYAAVFKLQTLDEVTRPIVARWITSLSTTPDANGRPNGIRTIANKAGYLKELFNWAQNSGHYPKGDNPAEGHVKLSKRVKQNGEKNGYYPFSMEQIQTLYAPNNLAKITLAARWGALIGLYTGARVSEVGQLYLSDFITVDGVHCFRITDEGKNQSLKNESSRRIVPIHSRLIELGILERLEHLRQQKETQFFPSANLTAINGAGNWLTKQWGPYMKAHGVKRLETEAGKYGFHSLRSNVIQAMQAKGINPEVRARIAGHTLEGEHFRAYSGDLTPKALLGALETVDWGLGMEELKNALQRP